MEKYTGVLQQKSLRMEMIPEAQTNQAIELSSVLQRTSKAHKFTKCRNTKAMTWLNLRTKAEMINSYTDAKTASRKDRYPQL